MKFTNKVAYCKITFPHIGEVNFIKALNLPIVYEPVLDETLDTATIKLTDLRKADYPTVDVSKAFEPFSLVRIGFEGQQTEIRMLIAHDDCKLKRKDEGPYKSWSHTVQLVEETKQLERESVDVLTFTNYLKRDYINGTGIVRPENENWSTYDTPQGGSLAISPPSHYKSLVLVGESFQIVAYNEIFFCVQSGGEDSEKNGIKLYYNDKFDSESRWSSLGWNITLKEGKYRIDYMLFDTTGHGYDMVMCSFTFYAVKNIDEQLYSVSDVLERILNLTPLHKTNEENKYKFDETQLKEYSNEESPEFAFTGHTLFEAMLLVAQYKGAFPKLKSDTISFRTLWNGKTLTETALPPSIEETNSSDINQYCTYLETEVQNLVGVTNSRIGTIVEPYADGFKTTRSSGSSEISEDTAIISTTYNLYQNVKLEIGSIGNNRLTDGDITPYVYEQGEYDGLSDYFGLFSTKGYALKWIQMSKNYLELAHRVQASGMLSDVLLRDPAISNIIYAKTGERQDSAVLNYLKNLVGINDGNSFADLMFRSEYIPILNARIKQYKDCFKDFHHNGSIKYNQTAELVDSEMYGEHLKQLIRKIGNATKRCTYIFDKIDDIPEVGTVVDGYSVYDVQMSIRENEVVATIFYVKYAELSQYIGVKNAWKDSDVSTNKCYNRAISYNEFLLFTHDHYMRGTSLTLSGTALNGLLKFTSASPLTCVEATGHYDDGSPLNTVLLPVVSLAVGNSLFFQWGYEDNYSAGYMSEKAPDGATSVISGTKYNRAQKAVKYCDMYGRIETYDFKLMRSGPVPNGSDIGWQNSDGTIEYSAEYVTRQIGYSLPLKPEELVGWIGEEYITVNDLLVEKNSSEALTFSVQLHYCAEDENFIVGSGLTNFCSLVGGEAQEVALFGFNERINIFNRRPSVKEATRLSSPEFKIEARRITITLPDAINNYLAWAYMGKDKSGNWQIIFGENRDLEGSDFMSKLYLLPMHKLEDFV